MVERNIVNRPILEHGRETSGVARLVAPPWREDGLTRFTALVQIFAEASGLDRVERALSKLENLEGLFEVTGEFDIVALISAADNVEFGENLKNIRSIEGVKATVISVVLKDLRAPMMYTPVPEIALA
jgi:DNA-binding Lrp family transcriptional regulator